MTSLLRLLYSGRLLLCALLAGLLSQRAVAQPAAALGCRVVSHRAVPTSPTDFFLEQCILSADGHTQRPLMALPKGFGLEAATSSGSHNLYLLRKAWADTVQLLLTDSLGRVLRQPRQFMQRMGEWSQKAKLTSLPGGQGFIMTHLTGKGGHPEINIVCLGPDLAVRWKQKVANKEFTYVEQIAVNDSYVWVNLLQQIGSVTHQPQVWVARLATGQVTGTVLLTPTEEVESAVLVPAGLLMLCTTHRNYLPKPADGQPEPASRRRDIVRLVTPDCQQPLFQTLSWPASGRPHHHWKTARLLPDGSYELVGETYREVTNGGKLALAMLGGGLMGMGYSNGIIPASGYVNQQPVGLVVAQLGPMGELTHIHEVAVPEAMHVNPSDSTSTLPKGRPVDFRVRGFSTNQSCVVLNTTRQVLVYSLANHQLQALTQARTTTPTVLAIEAGQVTVGWTVKPGDTLPEVERLDLP